MYCSTPSTRRLVAAVLVLSALSSFLPAPGAAAAPLQRSTALPSLEAARKSVADAEEYLASIIDMETQARARVSDLSDREASLVRQIAEARYQMRRFSVDAYVTDRDALAYVLVGSDTGQELSARIAFATSAASQADEAARRYENLKRQVTPELVDLAIGIAELETKRISANDAVLAARANEAEAERQHALATSRKRAADEAEAAKLVRVSDTPAAPGATVQAAAVDDGLQGPPAPAGGPTEEQWARLRHCESTGNYQAVSKSGKYRGAYQFDRQTWATMGPPGDPAAASPAEQDRRARLLYEARGWRPWPQCGRHLR